MKRLNNAHAMTIVSLLALLPCQSRAETVYKYQDDQGRTVYSAQPPNDTVETVDELTIPDTRPSRERVEAARQVHEKNLQAAQTMHATRKQREQIIAEENRRKREQALRYQRYEEPAATDTGPGEQGPYYGIPGHGILVLPKGPRLSTPGGASIGGSR